MPSLRSLIMEDNEKVCDKAFTNGDVYTGSFSKQLPHGKGKYTWSDGTVYQGDWEERKMTGKGRLVLSSGAKYNGDFSGGYLHGFGTFSAPDGSTYSGSWRMNVQHGIGRREYCNSDIYDGSWKDGVKEGSGTYSWHTGNTYIGNWKGGNICGRGVMKWTNGDTFDGFWLNGIRHGCGVYKFADGGYYFGMWTDGLKDGKGTFYPAGSKHPSHKKCYTSLGNDEDGQSVLSHSSSKKSDVSRIARPNVKRSLSERISMGGISINSGRFSHRTSSLDESWRQCDSGRYTCNDSSYTFSDISDEGESSGPNKSTVVYEREYMQGVLRRERVMNYKESSHKNKEESIFHPDEVTKRSCVNIFKSKKNYYLMLNLQFGIRLTGILLGRSHRCLSVMYELLTLEIELE